MYTLNHFGRHCTVSPLLLKMKTCGFRSLLWLLRKTFKDTKRNIPNNFYPEIHGENKLTFRYVIRVQAIYDRNEWNLIFLYKSQCWIHKMLSELCFQDFYKVRIFQEIHLEYLKVKLLHFILKILMSYKLIFKNFEHQLSENQYSYTVGQKFFHTCIALFLFYLFENI